MMLSDIIFIRIYVGMFAQVSRIENGVLINSIHLVEK